LSNDATKLYFAPRARILIADVTAAATKLPVDVITDLDTVWTELGYVDETGIELSPVTNTNPITSMQSATPVKYVVKDASMGIKFIMQEFNTNTVELYFGKKWTTTGGVTTLDLASTPALLEKAMVIEWGDWVDGTITAGPPVTTAIASGTKNRLVIPRGMVSSKDVIKLERSGVQTLGITFDALDINGTLGHLITNAA
jgi:hypothetical protein